MGHFCGLRSNAAILGLTSTLDGDTTGSFGSFVVVLGADGFTRKGANGSFYIELGFFS